MTVDTNIVNNVPKGPKTAIKTVMAMKKGPGRSLLALWLSIAGGVLCVAIGLALLLPNLQTNIPLFPVSENTPSAVDTNTPGQNPSTPGNTNPGGEDPGALIPGGEDPGESSGESDPQSPSLVTPDPATPDPVSPVVPTPQPTTPQPTTPQQTTPQPTTPQPTTPTTPSTPQPTTPQPTTPQPTTPQPTTPQPTTPTPTPDPEPTTPTTPATPGDPLEPGGTNLSELEQLAAEVFRLTNVERQNYGLALLSSNSALTATALLRANECTVVFDHIRPNGTTCFTAFTENGIQFTAAAENIAYGHMTAAQVVAGWMNSPGHRANILDPKLKVLGVGVQTDSNGRLFWVQLFID